MFDILASRREWLGRSHHLKLVLGGVLAMVGLCGLPSRSQADFSVDVNFVFSASVPDPSYRTFGTLSFHQVDANNVQVTFSANLLSGEFITEWDFNYKPGVSAAGLTITGVSTSATDPPTISKGQDAFKADGDGYYDIEFDFPKSGNRLTGTESVTYNIFSASGVSASDFNYFSVNGVPGTGNYITGVHIQGITPTAASGNQSSFWAGGVSPHVLQPVPAPPAAILFGLGFAGVGLAGLRRRLWAKAA